MSRPFPSATLPEGWAAPPDRWGPDVLGDGFEARTLLLEEIDEATGEPVEATLVRHRPAVLRSGDPHGEGGALPRAVVLYLHGWNDYVFHWEAASRLADLGIAWYGLDARAAGRSLRPGQRHNYVDDLERYDAEIDAAWEAITADLAELLRTARPGRAREAPEHAAPQADRQAAQQAGRVPFVLAGHSTGGLVASLWAHRHPGRLAGVVLSSPWLESLPLRGLTRLTEAALDAVAKLRPDARMSVGDDGYARTLAGTLEDGTGAAEPGARPTAWESPHSAGGTGELDPFEVGWDLEPTWRLSPAPVYAGWVAAALKGQRRVAEGLDIDCPILVLTAARSDRGLGGSLLGFLDETLRSERRPRPDTADIVLDVPTMRRRAAGLGAHVTLVAIEGAIHDVLASRRDAREVGYRELVRWLGAHLPDPDPHRPAERVSSVSPAAANAESAAGGLPPVRARSGSRRARSGSTPA